MKQYQKLLYAAEFKITYNEEIEGSYTTATKKKAIAEIESRSAELERKRDHILSGIDEETYKTWKANYKKMIEIINQL